VGRALFNAKDAARKREFFINLAVDPHAVLEVYDDFVVSDDRNSLVRRPQPAPWSAISWPAARLAPSANRVTLTGGIYPGDFASPSARSTGRRRRA